MWKCKCHRNYNCTPNICIWHSEFKSDDLFGINSIKFNADWLHWSHTMGVIHNFNRTVFTNVRSNKPNTNPRCTNHHDVLSGQGNKWCMFICNIRYNNDYSRSNIGGWDSELSSDHMFGHNSIKFNAYRLHWNYTMAIFGYN